jgi:hypothetical protein
LGTTAKVDGSAAGLKVEQHKATKLSEATNPARKLVSKIRVQKREQMPEPNEVKPEGQVPPVKIEFSPEQQSKVDELIKESMGRAGREHREAAAKATQEAEVARSEALALKAQLATLRGDKEELAKITETIQQENIRIRKAQVIAEAAAKLGFFNPSQVAKLTDSEVQWDSDKKRFVILADDGSERLGIDGNGLTIDAFFKDFAVANPHLVRGDVKPGIGSSENKIPYPTTGEREKLAKLFGRLSDSRAANTLAINNPQEYKRLKREARSLGLIP